MTDIREKSNRRLKGPISPGQCRAARGFLGLSQDALGTAAGLSGVTIQTFERGQRVPHQNNMLALLGVFESKGVRFLAKKDGMDGLMLPLDMQFPLDKDD